MHRGNLVKTVEVEESPPIREQSGGKLVRESYEAIVLKLGIEQNIPGGRASAECQPRLMSIRRTRVQRNNGACLARVTKHKQYSEVSAGSVYGGFSSTDMFNPETDPKTV